MNWPDFINGVVFEFVSGLVLWANVRKLLRDRRVAGVYWQAQAFWTAWGVWNLYYYAHLEQWWSWAGGINIVLANAVWLALAWRYR